MSPLFLTIGLLLGSSTAHACDLDDCSLPDAMHHIGDSTATSGPWNWLHHDLALIRQSIRERNTARALELAHSLDQVLRHNAGLEGALNVQRLSAFHRTLQQLVLDAGGWPLAELATEGAEKQG